MLRTHSKIFVLFAVGSSLLTISCTSGALAGVCGSSEVREAVESFDKHLQWVAMIPRENVGSDEIRKAYASDVTPELLESWSARPGRAPGLQEAHRWPAGIEIQSVSKEKGGCRVEGELRYVLPSDETTGPSVTHSPVTLHLVSNDGWRVAKYTAEEGD